jgi:hypothetical protein
MICSKEWKRKRSISDAERTDWLRLYSEWRDSESSSEGVERLPPERLQRSQEEG